MRGSAITFDVKNQGNVHIQPRALRVKATGADGSVRLEQKIPGWYILAGGQREYRVDVPRTECAKIKDLTVEVDMEPQSLTETYAVPVGACAH